MATNKEAKHTVNVREMSLEDIKVLTDIDKIRECLKQIEIEEEEMDKQISLKMQNKDLFFRDLNTKMEKTGKPSLDNLSSQINLLKGNLEESYQVGLEPLYKLAYLYEQQNSVNELLAQLRSTQNVKIYQEELELGIENNDLNQSIQSINNYLNTDIDNLKKGHFSRYFKNEDHFNVEKFENYRLELIEKLKVNYRNGVENNDKDFVLDQIKKLPKLGEPGLAIKLLNDYIAKPLINLERSSSSRPIILLKQLLESLVFQITEYQEWIGDHFGSGWFLSWLHQLIEQVSPLCLDIFNDFKLENDWDSTLQKIHLSSMNSVNQTIKPSTPANFQNNEGEIDIKEVDRILDELTFMCQKIRLFELLILQKINEEKLSIESEKTLSRHHYSCPHELIESSLTHLLSINADDIQLFPKFRQNLMNQFPLIEKFYYTSTIKQVIEMDEYEEGNGTSSSVDDSFYLIKKGSFRSLTNCNLETFQQSIQIYKEVLIKLVLPSFDPKPKNTGPGGAQVTTLKNMLISINNTGTSQKHVNTLIADLQSVCQKILTNFPPSQKLEFETCILSLKEIETRFIRSHQNNFDRLITRSIMPKLKDFMLVLSQESDYILEKEEDIQLLSTIELKFKSRVQPFLRPYETNLLEFNFKYLMEKISEIISNQFELEFINKKKFNWFGAQKLDSDLRLIIQFLSSLTEIYIKDLFRIPLTICDILIQEEIEHVKDILPDDLFDFNNSNTHTNGGGDIRGDGGEETDSNQVINKIGLQELAEWMKLRQDWNNNKVEDFIISLIPAKSD